MEDWAEIRRLHRADGMPIRAIARHLGISKNTVKRALATDRPPAYSRPLKPAFPTPTGHSPSRNRHHDPGDIAAQPKTTTHEPIHRHETPNYIGTPLLSARVRGGSR